MRALADQFLGAHRKRWLGTRPVIEHRLIPSPQDLESLEKRIGCCLPADMRFWLTTVGFCHVDDELSIRSEWFRTLDQGHLKGAVMFAQDTLGSFYAFVPDDGRIVFFARSQPGYAVLSADFRGFLQQLAACDFNVLNWVDSIPLMPYDWSQE